MVQVCGSETFFSFCPSTAEKLAGSHWLAHHSHPAPDQSFSTKKNHDSKYGMDYYSLKALQ